MGQRTFLKRYFVSMNFSPELLRNGNIFRIHTELTSYSEAKKTMNTTKASRLSALEMLKEKSERKAKIKEQELELRQREFEFQKKNMRMKQQKERQNYN